jgi:hypothetical protein
MLCAVYTMHESTRSAVSWFGLNIKVNGLLVVWPQNHSDMFPSLCLKTVATVW